ncbi:MAG: hypothetical protein EAZ74_00385 [Alphaproteobacteria bacterium]|nr:MAG: hypothetical protein EAY76_02855 [Alphaproteobacteria bacterium]TAF16006.1 MAG: hypothetical protein EAZ74_00385 [Alphaproteobacteria bacterium]TAF76221.1 MAG: hypothetical protein EAZ52_04805 [Alphaproteobacteria bacterium]
MTTSLTRFQLPWLFVGLAALALSGIFSIIVAVAWHPSVKSIELFATLFRRSLIAHVNLSISVWFLCIMFMFSSHDTHPHKQRVPWWDGGSRLLMILSMIGMTLASLDSTALPHLNNYIPTLEHPLFFIALGAMLALCLLQSSYYFFTTLGQPALCPIVRTVNRSSHALLMAACACFSASAFALHDAGMTGELYYEMVFWGGGHVLQFLWVQAMMLCWLILAKASVDGFSFTPYQRYFWVALIALALTPLPYALYDVSSGEFRTAFTRMMGWICGIPPILCVAQFIYDAARGKHRFVPSLRSPYGVTLWCSLLLFGLGGIFAVMIRGITVQIPAHYHGSLVGVTVAMMGASYYVLASHGAAIHRLHRSITWQMGLLLVGQIMHIMGLFLSGGYGVQRKSPHAISEAMNQAELFLRIQSTGGGLAILGGLWFMIICARAWRTRKK